MRKDNRKEDVIRDIKIELNYLSSPLGCVMIEQGLTKIICSVTIKNSVPAFLKGSKTGWVEAEYAMLPCATEDRNNRETKIGKQTGRSIEIQRLIARSLRSCLDLKKLEEKTIIIDCDVIQADGSTRVCSINGAYVALVIAIEKAIEKGILKENPIKSKLAAVSIGITKGNLLVDLDFKEDSEIEVDLNLISNEKDEIIEIQGSAEKANFNLENLNNMILLGMKSIKEIIFIQDEQLKRRKYENF